MCPALIVVNEETYKVDAVLINNVDTFATTMQTPLKSLRLTALLAMSTLPLATNAQAPSPESPYLRLMRQAAEHAKAHHALSPVLSPIDASVLTNDPAAQVPVTALQHAGTRVIPWTTNDPDRMRAIIRIGVDGLISDYPDRLQQVIAEERTAASTPEDKARMAHFDVEAHRGGRGLRPENTLPSFESGMDQGISTIETDTGVTSDGVSLIWHDQFLNPQSCRRADGKAYTLANRVYIQDLSLSDAQHTFLCDNIHTGTSFATTQQNDLALSPVAVAFAAREKLISPYVPTYAEQLFRFARFYSDYYRTGPGKTHPDAARRAHTGETVRFNLETKIIPDHLPKVVTDVLAPNVPAEMLRNHTVSPQAFVDALCGAIERSHMESRSDVQSFDFRTLQLVEEQHSTILTVYLTQDSRLLSSEFLPESLRQ